jgi:hypothetical protein
MHRQSKVDEFCGGCIARAEANQRMEATRAAILRTIARENGFESDGPGVWTKTFSCHYTLVVLYEQTSMGRVIRHMSVLGEWCDAVRQFVEYVKRRLESAP